MSDSDLTPPGGHPSPYVSPSGAPRPEPEMPAYGHPSYGPPQGYPAYGYVAGPGRPAKPGTVIAAGVIAIIGSTLFGLLVLLATLLVGSLFAAFDLEEIGVGIVLVGLVLAGLCVVAIVAASLAMSGSNAWRIVLAALSAITFAACVYGTVAMVRDGNADDIAAFVVWAVGAALTIAFLFTKRANAWYASNPRAGRGLTPRSPSTASAPTSRPG